MRGKKAVRIRPLKAYVLRIVADPFLIAYTGNYNLYHVIYLQHGRQWSNSVYATDELDAWRKAKVALNNGDIYRGRNYY